MSITSRCLEAKLEGKKLVLFGAGGNGINTLSNLMYSYKVLVSYFCDNDSMKEGSFIDGIPIYSPEKLLLENRNETVIIICSGYVLTIAKQLFDMGFYNVYAYNVENANRKLVSDDLINCKRGFKCKKTLFCTIRSRHRHGFGTVCG
jgi:FlaA1/EpsC-like NDP-sugar epimerase